MFRRLNREELLASNPLSFLNRTQMTELVWRVYEKYDLKNMDDALDTLKDGKTYTKTYDVEDPDDDPYMPYIKAVEESGVKRQYKPLTDEPHLFLEFARLPDTKDHRMNISISNWINKYGLLGLHQDRLWRFYESEVYDSEFGPLVPEYSDRGGPGEPIEIFAEAALRANWVLSLYEAALSKNVEKIEEALYSSQSLFDDDDRYIINESHGTLARVSGGTHVDTLVGTALLIVGAFVQMQVNVFTYPGITTDSSASLGASLVPRNLLGAMYLQFYWLITSSDKLSHCKHCGRIIPHVPLMPGRPGRDKNRKPRKDKKFCNRQCRQNYHYHNRIKPRRRGS